MARKRRKKETDPQAATMVEDEALVSEKEALPVNPDERDPGEAAPVSERRSGGASTSTFDLAGTPLPEEEDVVPDISTPEHGQVASSPRQWREKRGSDLGEASIKFAAISVREERNQHLPLDGNEAYIIEWRFEGGNDYPVAYVPPKVADILRRLNDARRKYAEL